MAFLTKRSFCYFERLEDRRLLAVDMFVCDIAAIEVQTNGSDDKVLVDNTSGSLDGKDLDAGLETLGGADDLAAKVVNTDPSQGGNDPEPIDPAERRSPAHLRNRAREDTDSLYVDGLNMAEHFDITTFEDAQR